MLLPIVGIFAHELGDDREDRQGIERYILLLESQFGSNVNVVGRSPRGLRGGNFRGVEGWKRRISGIEGECTSQCNWYIDIECAVKVWVESRHSFVRVGGRALGIVAPTYAPGIHAAGRGFQGGECLSKGCLVDILRMRPQSRSVGGTEDQ